jgi:hypothetical protein
MDAIAEVLFGPHDREGEIKEVMSPPHFVETDFEVIRASDLPDSRREINMAIEEIVRTHFSGGFHPEVSPIDRVI